MAPRGFDRFMVSVEITSNPKVARFTDAEFRCLIGGVWALAAKANPRGCLAVGGLPATSKDIAHQAHCSVALATRTLEKMQSLRMLEDSPTHDCLVVHEWDLINPSPKTDRTNADRQRRYRALRNGVSNGVSNDEKTLRNAWEVEGEGEGSSAKSKNTNAELRSAVGECFAYWQERCDHSQAKLTADRRTKLQARLREGYTVEQVRQAIDGAAVGAFVNDQGRRFDDLELICRSGSKLEDFIGRTATVVSLAAHLPEWQRPTADWDAQVQAHLDAQEKGA